MRADDARIEVLAQRKVALTGDDGPAERPGEAAVSGLHLLPLVEARALDRACELDLRSLRAGGGGGRRSDECSQRDEENETKQRAHERTSWFRRAARRF